MTTRRPHAVALLLAATLLGTAACGDSSPGGGTASPPRTDPGVIAAGADLFAENCATCHGQDVRGTEQGPSLLSVVYEPNHHGDIAFHLAVQRGVAAHHWGFGDMPPVEGLDTDDIDAIVAFVRDRQRTEGFEPYP